MKKIIACYLAMVTVLAAENRFDNSTMDTAGGWKGSKKMVKEEGNDKNRCLLVSAKNRRGVSFSQEVDTRDVFDLVVKFRYRTKDYKGRGLQIRGVRQNGGFTFYNYTLTSDGQWHDITMNFSEVKGSHKIDFVFDVLEGEGDVYFDDISVEEKK